MDVIWHDSVHVQKVVAKLHTMEDRFFHCSRDRRRRQPSWTRASSVQITINRYEVPACEGALAIPSGGSTASGTATAGRACAQETP